MDVETKIEDILFLTRTMVRYKQSFSKEMGKIMKFTVLGVHKRRQLFV